MYSGTLNKVSQYTDLQYYEDQYRLVYKRDIKRNKEVGDRSIFLGSY